MRSGNLFNKLGLGLNNVKSFKHLKTCFLSLFMLLLCHKSIAQPPATSYTFARTSGTYSSISGSGTSIPGMLGDDVFSTGIPIGFTFYFSGTAYTTCAGNSNGVLSLSNTFASCCGINSGLIGGGGWIMAMWADDDGRSGGGGSPSAWYQTTGAVGSRVFTMEWNDFSVFSVNPFHMNWQVKLYEGTNQVQMCYGTFSSSPSGVIGIANSTSDYQTLPSSGSTTTNTSFNFSTLPANGSVLTFTPDLVLNNGNPQSFIACLNAGPTSINSLLTASNTLGGTFSWTVISGPTNGTLAGFPASAGAGTSVSPSGTTYQPTGAYSGPDAFIIQVTDGMGGVSSTVVNVTVTPTPITGAGDVCTGSTITLSSTTSGGTWSSSNPALANVGTGTGVVTGYSPGTPTISYTVSGCATTTTVTVNQQPTGISGTFGMCVGSTSTLTNGYSGGVWTSSNTGIATVGSASGTVSGISAGNATITYTMTGNCISVQQVTINPNPASITGASVVCEGSTITLSNATSGGVYTSSAPGVATIGGGSGVVTGISGGTTTITYTLSTGCNTTTPVTVDPLPASITGTMNVCVGLTTTLSSATSGGSWASSNGNATVGTGTGIVTGITAGTATITYTLSTGCFRTAVVTIDPLPAAITGTMVVCQGSTTTLANATGTGTWSSSNMAQATIGSGTGVVTGVAAGNPVITYMLPTGCISTAVLTVNPLPAAIGGTLSACPATTTTLTNATGGGVWTSNNTAVATIGSASGIATGVAAGTSTITYTLPTGCMITADLTINPNPAAITGAANVCIGATTTLASGTGGGTWTSSNGALATVVPGTGVVTGVATGNPVITYSLPTGCIATIVATVNPNPAAITGTTNTCVGLTSTLSNGSGSSTWSSSNTAIAGVGSGTGIVSGVAAGTVTITFTLPTGCIATTPFTVNPTPAAITGTLNVCVGSTRTLANATSGGTWSSSNIALADVGSVSGIVSGMSAGTVSITYTLPAGCTAVAPFSVNATPPANTGTATVCTGLTTTLSNATSGGTWSSSNTAQASVVSGTGVVTGVAAGNPIITYTTNPGSCFATTVMTVNQTPSANTGANNVCVGASTTLANSTGGGSWSTSNGNATVGAGTGIVTGVSVGTVSISYILSTGCFAVTNMTVNSTPAAISGSATVCTGQTTTLTNATSGGTWSSSDISMATVGSATGIVSGVATGNVTITYTTNPGSCFATYAMTVNQTPLPITGSSNLCIGVPTPLTNGIGGGTWTSSNTAEATIGSTDGIAMGVTVGTPTITYTLPAGCFATFPVTVNNQPAAITGTFIVCETFTTTLGNTSSGGLWTSSNSGQALVGSSSGVVTGVAAGTPAITYTLPGGCNSVQQITVNPQPASITGTAVVCENANTTLFNTTYGGLWSSSNPSLAIIGSTSGIVTGVSAGNPVVSYTLPAGCFSTVILTVNALPTIFSVTGGGSYCAGSTGLNVGLTGSASGISYQLYLGTTPVGSPLAGTGSALDFGVFTSAGTYTVVATNTVTACAVGMSGSAVIVVLPLPTVYTASGGGSYCAGGSGLHIYLNSSAAFGFSYQLYISGSIPVGSPVPGTGVMLDFGLQTTAGTYTIVSMNTTTMCTVNMLGSPTITVDPLPTAYAVTGGGGYCAGGAGLNVGLATSDIGINYQLFLTGSPVGLPLSGTGAALNFGLKTAGGIYTVVGTNNSTGCDVSMTGSVTVTVNPLPTVYAVTVTGGGSYCAGGTGLNVLLSSSTTGVDYQLYLDGTMVGSPMAGTGSSLDFGTHTAAGTYTVVATDAVTTCTNNMSGAPTITIDPLPTVFNVTGGGPYCAGGAGVHVGLSGSTVGVAYQLYDGATPIGGPLSGTGGALDFGLIAPGAATTYTVSATNATTTCANSMAGSATITIDPLPNNTYAVTGGGGYCVGDAGVSIGLSMSDVGISYQLYNGISLVGAPMPGTAAALDFGLQTAAGTYTIRATDAITLCDVVMSGSVVVTVNPLPVQFTVTGGGNYCSGGIGVNVGLSGSVLGVDYELYLDGLPTGIITSGTGVAISFGPQTLAGSYTVEATDFSTLCESGMTGAASITIDPLPTIYLVTGGGAYCTGGPGVHVGLSASNVGISYQLFEGVNPVGGPLAGTGAALDFGLQTVAGTYTVVATDITTLCVDNMLGGATVSIDPLPNVYNVTGGGSYCAGGTGVPVGVDMSDPGINYQLYNGSTPVGIPEPGTGIPITIGMQTAAGTYTIVAIDGVTGCTSNIAGFAVVSIDPLPNAYVVNGGGSYCSGGTGVNIGLGGSDVGISYQLFNGGPIGLPVIGTGLPISFGLQTAPGFYSVTATNGTTSCTNLMAGSAIVTINSLPNVFFVNGGGAYCSGGIGMHVGLGGSTPGVNYQLLIGGSPIGSPIPGTGGSLDFGAQTLPGTYTVRATNAATSCVRNMLGSVNISITSLPAAFAVTGGGSYCPAGAGVEVGLANSVIGIDYQLYIGGTPTGFPFSGTGLALSFGLQITPGVYTVVATDPGTSCVNNMTGSATVSLYPLPALHAVSGGGAYCAGGPGVSISLDGSDINISYQLLEVGVPTGLPLPGTGSPLDFGLHTGSGVYTVFATNVITGCTETMASSAIVLINALPLDQAFTGGGSYCVGGTGVNIGLASSETGVSYQLYNAGSPIGAPMAGTGVDIDFGLFTTPGVYTMVATNTTSLCTVNISGSVSVSINALPVAYSVSGGGGYCFGGAGVNVGLGNSQTGVEYQLYNGTTAMGSPVTGTGSAISFGLQTVAGVYTVKGLNTVTGCTKNMTGSATVAINPLPTTYTVTGGGGYCAGGPGVHIGLSGSNTGTSYQLYNGTSSVGMSLAGTGASLDFGVFTVAGTYTVTATNGSTSCANGMGGSTTVVVNALPVAYAVTGSGASYCAGGTGVTIYLSGTELGVSYQLYRGTTSVGSSVAGTGTAIDFGAQTIAGTYTVKATNATTACVNNMSGSASFTINPLPNVFVVIGGGSYCPGGTGVHVGLSGSNTGIRYQLYNSGGAVGAPVNGTGLPIDFGLQTASGSYTVIATNSVTGCVKNMTGSATVAINPLPVVYTVTGGGSYCVGGTGVSVGLSGSITGNSYQLLFMGTPLGAPVAGTGLPLNFGLQTTAGAYSVEATNIATGCTSNMTGTATVNINTLPAVFLVTGGGNYCAGDVGVHIGLSSSSSGISYQLYYGTTASGSPIAGTGSAIDFGTRTGVGSYTVRATNSSTFCTANMSGSAVVGVDPLPNVYNVVGGGSYCAGTPGVHIGLSGSTLGISYQLLIGGVPAGSPFIGTGLPIDFGLHTAIGSYTVVATNGTTGCVNTMSGSAAVSVNPVVVPSVTVSTGLGDTVCAGNLTTFTATATDVGISPAYVWTVNGFPMGSGSTYSYIPTNGDMVSVTLTSSAICATPATVSSSINMTVLPQLMPSVAVSTTPGVIVCQGTVVSFAATPTNGGTTPTYLWLKNGLHVGTSSTFSYIPADGDIVVCELTTNYRCPLVASVSSSTITMEVNTPVTPALSIVAIPGLNISSGETVAFNAVLTNTVPYPSYKWLVNGSATGVTSPTFTTNTLSNLDIITCEVTSGGGCAGTIGTATVTIHVSSVGVNQVNAAASDIKLMPNPNKGTFTIKGTLGTLVDEEVSLEITNMLGQTVYSSKVVARSGEINERVQMSNTLANGMYLLTLRSETEKKVFHLVVEQ